MAQGAGATAQKLAAAMAAAAGWVVLGGGCQPQVLPSKAVTAEARTGDAAGSDAAAVDAGGGDALGGQAGNDAAKAADAGEVVVVGSDKEPMVALPAGSYYRGASARQVQAGLGSDSELPQHLVQLKGFALDKHEVTVAQYMACMASGGCTAVTSAAANLGCNMDAPGRSSHPVNCVTWTQAHAYCQWAGKRLPTDAEWEYAARGLDNTDDPRVYPWGQQLPDCSYAVYLDAAGNGCGQKATWPVCSKPAGNSPQGLCDLAGNVLEFNSDWFYSYVTGIQTDPLGPASGTAKVIRGGSRATPAEGLRASLRGDLEVGKSFSDIGFRCAF